VSNAPDDSDDSASEESQNEEGFDPGGETLANADASRGEGEFGTGKIPPVEVPDEDEEEAVGGVSFGGPMDDSGEHPVVVDASTSAEPRPEPEPSELEQAYECLEIRTPAQEFEAYSRARLETLIRLGDKDKAEVTAAALKLGLQALRGVMGEAS